MIQLAEQHGGPAAAAQLRRDLERINRQTTGPAPLPWRGQSDLDRDEDGALLLHPENLAPALVWLHTADQWIRAGEDAQPVAPNIAVALQIIELMRQQAPGARLNPLDVLASYRVIAAEVLDLYRASRREAAPWG